MPNVVPVRLGLPAAVTGAYGAMTAADLPWAWHRFQDGVGATVAADSSGNNRPGVILSGASLAQAWALDAGGKAMTCDGTANGRMTNAAVLTAITGAFSVEAWVNTDTLTVPVTYRMIWTGRTTSYLGLNGSGGNGKLSFSVQLNGVQQSITSPGAGLTIGNWFHVVATWDTDKLRIYLNGAINQTSGSLVGPATLGTASPWIVGGYQAGSATENWLGKIAEVAIYTQALSANRIAAKYAARRMTFEKRIVLTV